MSYAAAKALIIATGSASISYLILQRVPGLQAALTVPMTAWILFQFRGMEESWDNLANLQNPVLLGINCFFASFIYLSWKAFPLNRAVYLSTAFFLLGGVLGTLIHKYWNIGG